VKRKVAIFGAGGIGRAIACFLADHQTVDEIRVVDTSAAQLASCRADLQEVLGETRLLERVGKPDEPETAAFLAESELIFDCLPGRFALEVAQLARQLGKHYVNATEHVAATGEIHKLAADAGQAFVLQAGLAPGYVNILAMSLIAEAEARATADLWEIVSFERLEMRVGALTLNAGPPSHYGFTWSTAGVATEYVENALVVRDHALKELPSLSERRHRVLGGVTYEEDLTSGGAADLCAALAGKIRDIDYKTLRWPGHYDYVDQVLASHRNADRATRIHHLEMALIRDVPHVELDKITLYAGLELIVKRRSGQAEKRRLEAFKDVFGLEVGGTKLRAIQATTASSLAQVGILALEQGWRGVKTQSMIPPEAFLSGRIVNQVYGRVKILE
jgi:saccharopine dehydrogenase-like NADP-dependent oxidoreductase